jgi:hypothetical protein
MPHPAPLLRLVDPSHHDTPTMLPEVPRLPREKCSLQGAGWINRATVNRHLINSADCLRDDFQDHYPT